MKLLAIDASTEMASVALMLGDQIFALEQGSQRTHAQLLLPLIDKLLSDAKTTVAQLDGIVFGCGPGSFTGLRIACSIAKGLAYPHNLPLYPVSCLGAIAALAREQLGPDTNVLAVIDARMQEMYWGYYAQNILVTEDKVSAVQAIQVPYATPFVVAGVGMDLYWPELPDPLKGQVTSQLNLYPNAASMLRLVSLAGIQPVSVAQAQPIYVRNQVTQGESRG